MNLIEAGVDIDSQLTEAEKQSFSKFMKDPQQMDSPWEPWWTYRAPQSFAISEQVKDVSKMATNLNLFKDKIEQQEDQKLEDNADFEDDQESEESVEEEFTDDLRRHIVQSRYEKIP